jgi:DNA-binding MarR family transcriptional regulator
MIRADIGVDEALRVLTRLLPELTAALKRAGGPTGLPGLASTKVLAPRHIPVLAHLLTDGPMSVSDLAVRLGLALNTTSLLASQLTEYGLVTRREDETDRRRTLVDLAPDRREAIAEWLAHRTEPIRRALRRMSPTQRAALCDALELLAAEILPPDPKPPHAAAHRQSSTRGR